MVREEDEVFAGWVRAEGAAKEALQMRLVGLLSRHAEAVVWQTLRDRRPEIVNEALYRALTKAGEFKGDSQFSTWFHAIVRNLCISDIRSQIKRREVSLTDLQALMVEQEHEELAVRDASKTLEGHERKLLWLKYHGADQYEIAQILGISITAVKQRWRRLKMKLDDGRSFGVRTARRTLGVGRR